jgi:hypothetical protein
MTILLAVACGCEDKKAAPAPPASASAPVVAPSESTAPLAASAPSAKAERAPPEAIAAQHVLVAYRGAKNAPKGVVRSKSEAKARAEEVAAKAKAGADFSQLVAEYSDDPGSKSNAGNLGKFKREKMIKAFSDAAFALAVDETSGAVETEFGFHVIKRNQ